MFSLFFWVVKFCHHVFFSWFHCLAAVVVNFVISWFHSLVVNFLFSWSHCLLLLNSIFLMVSVFSSWLPNCFSPGLAVFLLSILFSHDVGCFVFVNFLFSWHWVHYTHQILFFPCGSCESFSVLISSAFNLFPHWFCMLCATDQYLYVVDFLIKIPGH